WPVNESFNPLAGQVLLQSVTLFGFDHVVLIDVEEPPLLGGGRALDLGDACQGLVVDARHPTAIGDPLRHVSQLHVQDGGLHIVESAVVAPTDDLRFGYTAMVS